ncbi:MAG: hypothetical protein IPG35_15215 [Flavobacteriales bacterium]|nr:hypothetical protein [Flavobacteriales bacterium]
MDQDLQRAGQLDLDPGPFPTLVDPGKVYAKYTSSGQFLWGFSVENTTDLSEDYGGISCDDAGNLFIAGDLGQGTYDMDPGPGVFDLVVPSSCIGTFVARYRADGSLHWAEVSAWPSSFSSSRDIAALRDGSGFYFTRSLDNGGPLSGQIDVDPGPGIFNVYNDSQHLLRYDSSFAFIAHAYIGYGDQRLAVDEADNAYLMARASAGAGFWALKFDRSGQTLNQIYQTALISTGNLRLGDYVADEQGGAIGSYSNNCTASYYRFFKMNVSGLVDFSLQLYSGTDCTYPIAKGFDLRGGTFAVGSLNQNYAVDFDPGPGVLSLPSGNDDGVVALYGWCGGAPYDPFGIDVLTSSWCVGDTVSLAVDAFGDASTYTWDPGTWNIAAGQGTGTVQLLAVDAGPSTIGVAATNACGSSAPVTLPLTAGSATADLPPSETVRQPHHHPRSRPLPRLHLRVAARQRQHPHPAHQHHADHHLQRHGHAGHLRGLGQHHDHHRDLHRPRGCACLGRSPGPRARPCRPGARPHRGDGRPPAAPHHRGGPPHQHTLQHHR